MGTAMGPEAMTPRFAYLDLYRRKAPVTDMLPYPEAGLPMDFAGETPIDTTRAHGMTLWAYHKGDKRPKRYRVRNGRALHGSEVVPLWHFPGMTVWYCLDAWTKPGPDVPAPDGWRHPGPPSLSHFTRVTRPAGHPSDLAEELIVPLPCTGFAWMRRLELLVEVMDRMLREYQDFAENGMRIAARAEAATGMFVEILSDRIGDDVPGELHRILELIDAYRNLGQRATGAVLTPRGAGKKFVRQYINVAWLTWDLLTSDRCIKELRKLQDAGHLTEEHEALVALAIKYMGRIQDPDGTWDFNQAFAHHIVRPWIERGLGSVPAAYARAPAAPVPAAPSAPELAVLTGGAFATTSEYIYRWFTGPSRAEAEAAMLGLTKAVDGHLAGHGAILDTLRREKKNVTLLRKAIAERSEATLIRLRTNSLELEHSKLKIRAAVAEAAWGRVDPRTAPSGVAASYRDAKRRLSNFESAHGVELHALDHERTRAAGLLSEAQEHFDQAMRPVAGRAVDHLLDAADIALSLWELYTVLDAISESGWGTSSEMKAKIASILRSSGSVAMDVAEIAARVGTGPWTKYLRTGGGTVAVIGGMIDLKLFESDLDAFIDRPGIKDMDRYGVAVGGHILIGAGKILAIWGAAATAGGVPAGPPTAFLGVGLEAIGTGLVRHMKDADVSERVERTRKGMEKDLRKFEKRFKGRFGVSPTTSADLWRIRYAPHERHFELPEERFGSHAT